MPKANARNPVTPLMTLENIMPIKGTVTGSFIGVRSANATKVQVPIIAAAKAKSVRVTNVEVGRKMKAMRIPSCADAMVAPVVGDTNLLAQSCCMMRPAILIPAPVQSAAARRGSREAKNTCQASPSARSNSAGVTS